MKDSGIEWIGEIPEDWEILRLKHLGETKSGLANKKPEDFGQGFPFISYKNIYSNIVLDSNCPDLVESTDKDREIYNVLRGDAFFTGSSETIEELGFSSVCLEDIPDATYNGFCIRFRPNSFDEYLPDYYKYYFRSFATRGYLIQNDNSITRANLSQKTLKSLPVVCPSMLQQQKIANFLDKKVAEIDHILEKTRESIEEYKKYKQSIITEAVTKGLNPDVKMKDSGIEWIGEIPEHWRLCKIANIIDVLTDFTANGSFADLAKNVTYLDGEGFARVVRLTDLRVNFENPGVYVSEESFNYLKKSSLFGGEILIANVGAYAGLMCEMPSVDFKATLGPNMMLIKVKENLIFPHYLFLLSMCTYFEKQLQLKAISSAQPKLNKDDVRSVRFVLPPLYEQKKISDFIDSKVSNIDNLITQKEQLLSDLEAYKKSLIYECVTGKREVV
jgi:type I restriction enzyme S subunit